MPRQILPVAFAMAVGLIVIVDALFPVYPLLHAVSTTLISWAALLSAFAFLLGLGNILSVHIGRILQRNANSITSAIVVVAAVVTFALSVPEGPSGAISQWIFQNIYRPLESAFLALLAFFIFSAAFRGLRARSWEMTVLLLAALVVLIGQVPIGNLISSTVPLAKEWVMNVPALAGTRGILIGVALGTIATALRLLVGLDRPYAD